MGHDIETIEADKEMKEETGQSLPAENLRLRKLKKKFYERHQSEESLQPIHDIDTNTGDPSSDDLQKLKQEIKDIREELAEFKEKNENLEWQLQELTEWKNSLPGLAVFEEMESDDVAEGLKSIPEILDFLENLKGG